MTTFENMPTKQLGNLGSITTKTINCMLFLLQIYVTLFTCASKTCSHLHLYRYPYIFEHSHMYVFIYLYLGKRKVKVLVLNSNFTGCHFCFYSLKVKDLSGTIFLRYMRIHEHLIAFIYLYYILNCDT